jgi:hypothetical protein
VSDLPDFASPKSGAGADLEASGPKRPGGRRRSRLSLQLGGGPRDDADRWSDAGSPHLARALLRKQVQMAHDVDEESAIDSAYDSAFDSDRPDSERPSCDDRPRRSNAPQIFTFPDAPGGAAQARAGEAGRDARGGACGGAGGAGDLTLPRATRNSPRPPDEDGENRPARRRSAGPDRKAKTGKIFTLLENNRRARLRRDRKRPGQCSPAYRAPRGRFGSAGSSSGASLGVDLLGLGLRSAGPVPLRPTVSREEGLGETTGDDEDGGSVEGSAYDRMADRAQRRCSSVSQFSASAPVAPAPEGRAPADFVDFVGPDSPRRAREPSFGVDMLGGSQRQIGFMGAQLWSADDAGGGRTLGREWLSD